MNNECLMVLTSSNVDHIIVLPHACLWCIDMKVHFNASVQNKVTDIEASYIRDLEERKRALDNVVTREKERRLQLVAQHVSLENEQVVTYARDHAIQSRYQAEQDLHLQLANERQQELEKLQRETNEANESKLTAIRQQHLRDLDETKQHLREHAEATFATRSVFGVIITY
jgi:Fe2+ transport system protein B